MVTNRRMHLRLAKQQTSGLCDDFRVCELCSCDLNVLIRNLVRRLEVYDTGNDCKALLRRVVPGVADPTGCRLWRGSSQHGPISQQPNYRVPFVFCLFFFGHRRGYIHDVIAIIFNVLQTVKYCDEELRYLYLYLSSNLTVVIKSRSMK
jgi:hypothetical protein